MALKLYPIGIQTFERIRKEDKLYIDNTQYCVTKVGINFDSTQGNITDWVINSELSTPISE